MVISRGEIIQLENENDTIILKLQIELEIAAFSKLENYNAIALTKNLLLCAIFLLF